VVPGIMSYYAQRSGGTRAAVRAARRIISAMFKCPPPHAMRCARGLGAAKAALLDPASHEEFGSRTYPSACIRVLAFLGLDFVMAG
jgi:hypothetical protein